VTDTSSHPPASHARRLIFLSIKMVISAGLLWLLLSRVDLAQLWQTARTASPAWLTAALGIYLLMCFLSAWRWRVLLRAQHIAVPLTTLTTSFLVATFFNNFLPSNIGGDVVRIGDTARQAGSKTLAATVVLLDRGIGLLGLIFVAALGASAGSGSATAVPGGPVLLWLAFAAALVVAAPLVLAPALVGRLLRPLEAIHREWVRERLERLTTALGRFREMPAALVVCFLGGILVQVTLVLFYAAVARGLAIPVGLSDLAILVPLSFIVQMVPVSVNGFGVREATFTVYFSRIGLPAESAFALSFIGAMLIMVFSLSGAVSYVLRGRDTAAAGERP
jgi:glycosyltransferase 2 family protein